nr:c-type cytochrome [Pseudopedobacter sp.]
MKKFKKILVIIVVFTIIIIAALIGYVKFALPNTGEPENINIEKTAARVERGKYLANAVSVCMDCHSTRDWSKFSAPMISGTNGKGGDPFTKEMGFPGNFYAPNITPAGIGSWTDGEVFRAITTGVSQDGRPLFPLMPHPHYGKMDREDIYSLIAYIRSLPPINNEVPKSEPEFPFSLILQTIPQKASFSKIPNREKDPIAYGAYLINAAACADCHTPVDDKGQPLPGMDFAGGRTFPTPSGIIKTANISQDVMTGIGSWTEDVFVSRFKMYADSNYKPQIVEKGEMQTLMPWTMYSHMKTEDLKAIYAYLKTIKPVKNQVIKFQAIEN